MRTQLDELSMREREEFEQEKEMAQMQSDHNIKIKEMEIEAARIETRWTIVFRIPIALIMLPVRILFGLAYIASVIVKYDVPEQYWKFISLK